MKYWSEWNYMHEIKINYTVYSHNHVYENIAVKLLSWSFIQTSDVWSIPVNVPQNCTDPRRCCVSPLDAKVQITRLWCIMYSQKSLCLGEKSIAKLLERLFPGSAFPDRTSPELLILHLEWQWFIWCCCLVIRLTYTWGSPADISSTTLGKVKGRGATSRWKPLASAYF